MTDYANFAETSVMIDASHDVFEENIRVTKEVVDMAHARGVTVEAELGRLGGIEEHVDVSAEDAFLTDPAEALEFVERTGIDYLAVAIGTSHGAYKGKGRPFIDHPRIEKIASLTPIPLVMHGAVEPLIGLFASPRAMASRRSIRS